MNFGAGRETHKVVWKRARQQGQDICDGSFGQRWEQTAEESQNLWVKEGIKAEAV